MKPYIVQIKNGAAVRLEFAAMAPDSLTAAEQHECLCERGEYVRVMPPPSTEARLLEIDKAVQQDKQRDGYSLRNDARAAELDRRAADREQA